MTSFTLGRLPQIPINGVTTSQPVVDKQMDETPWIAYYDTSKPILPGACSSTFCEVVSLCIIVNSTLTLFFSPTPTKAISGTLLLREYKKYIRWKEALPALMASTYEAPPHVLCAHLLWHSAVLLLFRPFLKAKITDSHVMPQDICRQSANAISELFGRHKALYELQGIYSFQIQCLLTACTIHIIRLPAIASKDHFIDACNGLHDLKLRNSSAESSINILKDFVERWEIILPRDAELALYRDATPPSPIGAHAVDALPRRAVQPPLSPQHAASPAKRKRLHESNQLFGPSASQPPPLLVPTHSGWGETDEELKDELGDNQPFEGLDFPVDNWYHPSISWDFQDWNMGPGL